MGTGLANTFYPVPGESPVGWLRAARRRDSSAEDAARCFQSILTSTLLSHSRDEYGCERHAFGKLAKNFVLPSRIKRHLCEMVEGFARFLALFVPKLFPRFEVNPELAQFSRAHLARENVGGYWTTSLNCTGRCAVPEVPVTEIVYVPAGVPPGGGGGGGPALPPLQASSIAANCKAKSRKKSAANCL